MRLYCGSSVSSKYQATTANELKSIIFQYGCFLAKYFCEYLLLFFYKPVYSCKDTTGDFNIDLLNLTDQQTELFTNIMFSSNYYPLINKPTRLGETSSTAIDHIWTNITVPFLKIAHIMYFHNIIKNPFDCALVRLE